MVAGVLPGNGRAQPFDQLARVFVVLGEQGYRFIVTDGFSILDLPLVALLGVQAETQLALERVLADAVAVTGLPERVQAKRGAVVVHEHELLLKKRVGAPKRPYFSTSQPTSHCLSLTHTTQHPTRVCNQAWGSSA